MSKKKQRRGYPASPRDTAALPGRRRTTAHGGATPPTRPFSLLIKPAGADCNIRCDYCFYYDRGSLYPGVRRHRMSDETLDRLVASYMETEQPTHSFGWQGGEPTLMGVDFFRRAVELQQAYGRPGARVANGVQTNGMLITDELAQLFHDYRFLLGVSLDGPEEVHDTYRKGVTGGGTYARVREGIHTLLKHQVDVNILVLVSQANVHRGAEVYEFLRDEGFRYHQYIPCVEFGPDGRKAPFAITGEEWGRFLNEVYDAWYPRDTRRVSIRHFDSVLEYLVKGTYNVCSMSGRCNGYFVVEHTGDVYPCDFAVSEETLLGNIHHTDWGSLQRSPAYRRFAARKAQWSTTCAECPYLHLCSGDCTKHRRVPDMSGAFAQPEAPGESRDEADPGISLLCRGWQEFYEHTLPGFTALAEQVRVSQHLSPVRRPAPDELCHCGSEKLYRNCHGTAPRFTVSSRAGT